MKNILKSKEALEKVSTNCDNIDEDANPPVLFPFMMTSNDGNGYFQIGDQTNSQIFILSISVFAVDNLNSVLKESSNSPDAPLFFQFSVLGVHISTPAFSVDKLSTASETVIANISSNMTDIRKYIAEAKVIISLCQQDTALAEASLNLGLILSDERMTIQVTIDMKNPNSKLNTVGKIGVKTIMERTEGRVQVANLKTEEVIVEAQSSECRPEEARSDSIVKKEKSGLTTSDFASLIEIFKMIRQSDLSKFGLMELYKFTIKKPHVNLEPFLKESGKFIREYVERGFKKIEEELKIGSSSVQNEQAGEQADDQVEEHVDEQADGQYVLFDNYISDPGGPPVMSQFSFEFEELRVGLTFDSYQQAVSYINNWTNHNKLPLVVRDSYKGYERNPARILFQCPHGTKRVYKTKGHRERQCVNYTACKSKVSIHQSRRDGIFRVTHYVQGHDGHITGDSVYGSYPTVRVMSEETQKRVKQLDEVGASRRRVADVIGEETGNVEICNFG